MAFKRERESQADALLPSPPRRAAASVYVLAVILAGAAAWAHLTPVDVFVRAPGIVRPEGEVLRIIAGVGGRIRRVEASEGAAVGAGDLLIEVDAGTTDERLAAIEEQIALRRSQLDLLGKRLATADEIHRAEQARIDAEIRSESAAFERRQKDHGARLLASGVRLERARYGKETAQTLFGEDLVSFEALSAASAELQLAELEHERVRVDAPDPSVVEVLQTARRIEAARFEAERGEILAAMYPAEIALSELRLERGRALEERVHNQIRSPARGRLTLFEQIHPGEYVTAGEILGTLERAGHARVVEASLANGDAEAVHPGQEARLLLDDSRTIRGTVLSVSPDVRLDDPARGSFRVVIEPEEPGLRLGLAMEVRLLTRTDSVLGLLAGRIRESFRSIGG